MNNFILNVDKSAEIEILRQSKDNINLFFRIKLITGCAGFKYDFSWSELKPTDIKVNSNIIIDPKSFTLINNSTIYFHKSLLNNSFKIENPNTSKVCGCGMSWS